MIGSTIAHYKILAELGEGGMGVVYKAEDTNLDRTVALKFLAPHLVSNEDHRKRFVREAKAAAALSHPNICTVYEIGEAAGRIYIAMAYLEGQELSDIIGGGTMETDQAADLAVQFADGLAEAHSKGVVHRDIKPANLFVTSQRRGVILDFGLAQLASSDSRLTREGTTLGTCAYMSPEQASGVPIDARTDVWALGCVLYEMLAGEPPFHGHYEQAIIYSILNEEPEPLKASAGGLASVVGRCLAKKAEDRYRDGSGLLAALRAARESAVVSKPSSPGKQSAPRPSIVVLPFQNRGRDEEDEYFSDGVAEDIISTLGNVEGLRVIPRASAFHFKGKRPSLAELVSLLHVSHALEGSVRRAGNRLRITVELIETADGEQIWTQRYDRVMEDIFDVQDEISRAVADALKVKLLGESAASPARRGTADVEAYNLVLKGRHLASLYRRGSLDQSLKCYEEAIRRDPEFAAAHAYKAENYLIRAALAWDRPHDVMPKMKQAATRALALDDQAAEGHLALGIYLLYYEWDCEGFEREIRRTMELDPAGTAAARYLGEMLVWCRPSRVQEARELLEQAVARNPLDLQCARILVQADQVEGRFQSAHERQRAVLELNPDFNPIYYQIASTYAAQGKMAEAAEACEKALTISPGDGLLQTVLGMVYALGGRQEKAIAVVEELEKRRQEGYAAPSHIGSIRGALGEYDQAFEWFDKAVEERDSTLAYITWLKLYKGLEPLLSDTRFQRMLRTIGMEY